MKSRGTQKNTHPNIPNVSSLHQNKFLAFKLKRGMLLQSCLKGLRYNFKMKESNM